MPSCAACGGARCPRRRCELLPLAQPVACQHCCDGRSSTISTSAHAHTHTSTHAPHARARKPAHSVHPDSQLEQEAATREAADGRAVKVVAESEEVGGPGFGDALPWLLRAWQAGSMRGGTPDLGLHVTVPDAASASPPIQRLSAPACRHSTMPARGACRAAGQAPHIRRVSAGGGAAGAGRAARPLQGARQQGGSSRVVGLARSGSIF